jgi:glycine cleavage system regulatory protein
VTYIGDDRPGLIEQLSSTIEQNGGNWNESRSSQLGGKFAGLVLVTLPDGRSSKLLEDLQSLAASGLSVRVTPANQAPASDGGKQVRLSVMGPDRQGIVKEIAQALAARQINVVEMFSEVKSAPMSAEAIFQANIEATIPETANTDDLVDSLEEIANAMTLDIDLTSS